MICLRSFSFMIDIPKIEKIKAREKRISMKHEREDNKYVL